MIKVILFKKEKTDSASKSLQLTFLVVDSKIFEIKKRKTK